MDEDRRTAAEPPWLAEQEHGMAARRPRTAPPAPAPARRSTRGGWVVAGLTVVAAGAVVALAAGGGLFVPARPPGWPSPPAHPSTTPLGAPPALAATSDAYEFLQTQRGSDPVAWDPCRPIHYVVGGSGRPRGADDLLTRALAEVSSATGLVFVADGVTDERASERRPLVSRELYGDRWAPVLIAWESLDENPGLAGDVIGVAEPSTVTRLTDGLTVIVTGQVRLDAAQIGGLLGDPDGYQRAYLTLIHELGHLVGLDHVDDPAQVMYPEIEPGLGRFQAGDLTGLARLGTGRCAPDV